MIIIEQVVIPEKKIDREKETICDICGAKTSNDGNWLDDGFEFEKTRVRLKRGWTSREGGDWNEIEYDICPKCFKEKLIPFIKSLSGKEPRESEHDW